MFAMTEYGVIQEIYLEHLLAGLNTHLFYQKCDSGILQLHHTSNLVQTLVK